MEGHEQLVKSRVVKVDSEETWNFFINQARKQGCAVIVHFTAAWCIPSVAMKPFFQNLAVSFQDTLFLTVDVDDVKEVASKMKIKAMPTFVLMRGGVEVDKLVGANPDEISKRIDGFVHSSRSYITPS
ncbi:Thioredoxin-like protein cxxs1 [Sarracenia purpurea var. burkii]